MNNAASLQINHRLVTSPFGLLGTDENALSFSLGYTLQKCLPLLQWFLKHIGISGIQLSRMRDVRIDLQRHRSEDSGRGITDIEIHLPGYFRVIVEAKVGLATPTVEQCCKYLPRFEKPHEPYEKLVALVISPSTDFVESYARQNQELSSRLVGMNWSEFLPQCIRYMQSKSIGVESKRWVRSFYTFLDQEYELKAFSTEVWILSTSKKPLWSNGLSHWDIHQKYRVWWDYKEHTVRPLYLAFRVDGILDAIWRVNKIEHEVTILGRVPEMKNIKEDWPRMPCSIWHFDPPVKLPNPIRTGGGMYNRRVRCDLDKLLACETVLEIEQAMKQRREAQTV